MKKIKMILLGMLFPFIFLKAQDYQKRADKMDSILTAFTQKNMFNGAVLIAKNGKPLLNKGYGMANFSYTIPITGTTKFKLASVSKQFTAACILLLEEQGKLSTDDKLIKFIPDYPNGDKITVQHLLTHTSGIVNVTSLPFFDSIQTIAHTHEQMIKYFKPKALEFEPGSKFNYSNSGYILLSYIIEKASGTSYENFVEQNVFKPLGMMNSGLYKDYEILSNVANGYTFYGDTLENVQFVDMSIPTGAGALYSTTEDLLKWDQALYSDKLLKSSSRQKMFTPFLENYGYGFFIDNYTGKKWYSHSGGIQGFATVINRFVDDTITVIILKNIDNKNIFNANRTARAVMFDQPYELPIERTVVKVDEKIYKKLCGDYELMPGFVLSIFMEDGKLMSRATGQDKLEIFPEADYKYFLKIVDAQLTFEKDKKGNVNQLTLHQAGKHMPGKRIEKPVTK